MMRVVYTCNECKNPKNNCEFSIDLGLERSHKIPTECPYRGGVVQAKWQLVDTI